MEREFIHVVDQQALDQPIAGVKPPPTLLEADLNTLRQRRSGLIEQEKEKVRIVLESSSVAVTIGSGGCRESRPTPGLKRFDLAPTRASHPVKPGQP
jgi:hypothetical protein